MKLLNMQRDEKMFDNSMGQNKCIVVLWFKRVCIFVYI
jgi:hypothetical protein